MWIQKPGMEEPIKGYTYAIDEHFIDNLGLQLLAGRGFSANYATDSAAAVVVNETALRVLDLGTPQAALGQRLTIRDGRQVEIIGVVADYHSNNAPAMMGTSPLVLVADAEQLAWANVRVRPGATESVVAQLQDVWKRLERPTPLDYGVYTVQLTQREDLVLFRDLQRIVGGIAVLAFVIACLGLLGAAAYSAAVRTKEVGIRKVHGARVFQVVLLLSRDFMVLVLVAVALATPLAWFINNLWLAQFASRIALSPWVFTGCVLAMGLFALAAIGSQTFKAALADPVKSLRYE